MSSGARRGSGGWSNRRRDGGGAWRIGIIAVGDMVDAVVLLVENAARRIESEPERDRTEVVLAAARELGAPLFSSLPLIAVSFLPIFTLQAQEGRLFTPLALTKTFAMIAAALLTVTLAPALAVTLLRGRMPREERNPLSRGLRFLYRPAVGIATRRPWAFVALALLATAVTVPLYRGLGREFMPPLYEEAFLSMPVTLPGISVEQARQLLTAQDAALASIPEVEHVLGKAGRAETATDPAPLSMLESTIIVKPQDQWRPGMTPEKLVREMESKLEMPGVQNAFTMAGPMFGGLATLAVMTSLVLPAAWVLWRQRQLRRGTLAASLACRGTSA